MALIGDVFIIIVIWFFVGVGRSIQIAQLGQRSWLVFFLMCISFFES